MKLLRQVMLAIGMFSGFVGPACVVTAQQSSDHNIPPPHNSSVAAEQELQQAFALRKNLVHRDLLTAIGLFTTSAQRFMAAGEIQKASHAELEAGDTFLMMSDYRKALIIYQHSLKMAVNLPEPKCLALSHMARTYANLGRVNDAAQYSTRAVEVCQVAGSKRDFADALESEGEARFWSADMPAAVKSLTHARSLFSEVKDRDGEALATMMLAQAINADDREQSSRLARTALNQWAQDGNQYGAARAHMTMAFFAVAAGDFSLSQCHCSQALPVFHGLADKDNEAIALNVLGMVALESGDAEASLRDYRQARRDFAALQDDLGEAESITGMGAAFASQHNYGPLLALYKRKLYLANRAGNRALVASALLDIAGVYVHRHSHDAADANIRQALLIYRSVGHRYGESNALMRLGSLRIEEGRGQEALAVLQSASELKEKNGQVEDLARIQYMRARIYRRLERLEESRAEIEKTIAIIESQRLRINKFDSRAQYFASVHSYYSLYIQVLMALQQAHPDRGYMQLAFEAAERSKVRALLDLLQNTRQVTSCDELLARDSDSAAGRKTQDDRAATPNAVSARSLTLPEIQTEIGDSNAVLVEYALGDEKSYAWIVDGRGISWRELSSELVIRRTARAFREALLPPVARVDESAAGYLQRQHATERVELQQSRKLAGLLLAKLNLPAGRHVLIVPDGPLQYIPFAALPAGGSAADTDLFVAQHDLTMVPSASVLAALRETAARRPPPTSEVAIFADPVFEKIEASSAPAAKESYSARSHDLAHALRDTRGSQHIVPLPASRTEAFAIQKIVGPEHARMALGFDANRGSVINGSLAHHRVIHFATHGIIDTQRPEMSGLILSLINPRGEHQDGYLRLGDIYNLKLSADLVVLSSCDSALGKDLESEGVIGLPRGFLYAGARSVIASLWKVDDEATAIFMKGLYSRMQQGESPDSALRESQLELAKDARYRQPYYWAAFVLEGDYRWKAAGSEKH